MARVFAGAPLMLTFIGEAPGPHSGENCPLWPVGQGTAGYRLCKMTGLSRRAYLHETSRLNLLPWYSPHWRSDDAQAAAGNIRGSNLFVGRSVILVGRRVYDAFFPMSNDWLLFEWMPLSGIATSGLWCARLACIPHPSGRNRAWNDPEVRAQCEEFLRGVLETSEAAS